MTISVTKPSVNLREKLNELDFDRVPFQKMPAGSVLQTKVINTASSSHAITTSTTPIASGLELTITPYISTSKLIITLNINQQITGGTYGQHFLYRDGTNITAGTLGAWEGNTSANVVNNVSLCVTEASESTTTRTYQHYFLSSNGSTLYGLHAQTPRFLSIMEIAQ